MLEDVLTILLENKTCFCCVPVANYTFSLHLRFTLQYMRAFCVLFKNNIIKLARICSFSQRQLK